MSSGFSPLIPADRPASAQTDSQGIESRASDPGTGASAHALDWAHPIVREWFLERFESATEPQVLGWPHILARRSTVISAPTGSGKTLAAFLACIDRLVRKALSGELTDTTEVVYVSPLKALGNDIQKNLEGPLAEILQKAGARGLLMPEIRVAVRTGDTLMHERRAMLKRPPHILVTTPESLYILLTAEKSRAILRSVDTVIVDEVHAVADDKRGAHLALSLERLTALNGRPPVRIGLSATQKPIEEVARFVAGVSGDGSHPLPVIVDIGHRRPMDLAIEVPSSELGAVASNEMWGEIYDRLAALVSAHRSTLVFVNTRRLAERVSHHLEERLGEGVVAAHHGSLSRKLRLAAERKLKAGELRVLVATASLELGIDIGHVDLACQIGSPRAIAVALQRMGRAGHWRGAIPKGRIFATTLDELLECAALVQGIRRGELDQLMIPEAPLDVLAQQIVAACASEDWQEDDLFALVRRAYPYRALPRADFDAVVAMLADGIAARRGRYGAYVHHDRVNHRLRGRRGSRLAAITSGGAIPENALYTVVATPDDAVVGTVDEDFAVESLAGDIMLLGNSSWRIRRVERSRVVVEDAKGAPPTVPFWRGEAPGRTAELSEQVALLRQRISDSFAMGAAGAMPLPGTLPLQTAMAAPAAGFMSATTESAAAGASTEHTGGTSISAALPTETSAGDAERNSAIAWLKEDYGLDDAGAEQAINYVLAGRAVLGAVPTLHTVIAERFFDESGGMQLVIHAPFGARINKAWGLALRKKFCRSFNFELQAAATDNGVNISLGEQHSFPLADVFHYLHAASVQEVLEQAVLAAPVFGVRWRWVAGRALALLRFQGGKKVPPPIQRMRAEDLLAAVFPQALACQENIAGDIVIPDHPLVRETMKDVLEEALDLQGLKRVLADLDEGRIRSVAVDTPVPSAFSHEILNANPYAYLDDAPLEERRARAVEMRRVLPAAVATEFGRLDPAAIAQVRADAWPDVRDADELHDALCSLIAVPDSGEANPAAESPVSAMLRRSIPDWSGYFAELVEQHRAARVVLGQRSYWVCAEKVGAFRQIFGAATIAGLPDVVSEPISSREDAVASLVTGWMSHFGPTTASELANVLGLTAAEIAQALLRLEAAGNVLRGQFTDAAVAGNNGAAPNDGAMTEAEKTEWCERRLLARIHRLTLGELRRQIAPVSPSQLMRWLLRWQHLAPVSQLLGERGTLEALRQLQGFETPANAWERRILARRVAGYTPEMLDRLCLTGAVGWGRLSPHPATLETWTAGRRVVPTSVAPIAFFVRDDADWMMPRSASAEAQKLSPVANDIYKFLQQRGASFFADIVKGTGRLKAEVETGLWELVTAGLLTADGFDNLRALIDVKRRAGHGSGRSARPRHSTGRWSLLYVGEAVDRNRAIEATCGMLLRRYGIVFREMLTRESILPPWREVLGALRRLEDRGEVRGGRFVSDFLGEQFALPIAVESLRAMRQQRPSGETVTVSAADPLNMAGILVPGERVAANSGKFVTFRDGVVAEEEPATVISGLAAVR